MQHRTVEAALLDVKEVKVGTKLPGTIWESNARILAEEVIKLRRVIYDYEIKVDPGH